MLHVTIGIIYLTVVAVRIRKLSVDDIEIAGLYWHFVDLVWVFVFPLVYVLSINRI
jgi:cytochrome c oxidase subunit 3